MPGVVVALGRLRDAGFLVGVVTNNSFHNKAAVTDRLTAIGITVDVTSAVVDAGAHVVAGLAPSGKALVVGGDALVAAVTSVGLEVVTSAPADVVIVGNEHDLSHESLSSATEALMGGAAFVVLSMDRFYLDRGGVVRVGAGALATALAYSANRHPDVVIGKPSPTLLLDAAAETDVALDHCLYVGDSLESDIAAAVAAQVAGVLVLTGVESEATIGRADAPSPLAVMASVVEVVDALLAAGSSANEPRTHPSDGDANREAQPC